jgi:2-keto-4-pentenoate hydratase
MTRIEATAAALHAAREARGLLAPLVDPPADQAEAYAAQRALAGAAPPAGFKIGATAQGMQQYLGVDGPMAGFMPGPIHRSGATLRFAGLVRPGVECEIALRLGRDIAPGPLGFEDAAAAVAACFPAIEVVENRYADFKALGAPTLIADQVFHAAAVVGADAAFDPRALDQLAGTISHDGAELGRGPATALLGHPLHVLQWLADSGAAHAFGGLVAGQVVLCGSVTPPFWLDRGGAIQVEFGALGSVSVGFA